MSTEMDGIPAMERLRDHYKHCIRLSASNKINPKNAFDLQLIDYMQDLLSNTEDGQMNFKIASSALDVGAKIYSNRVDRIQSEAQKVASSILMALDGQQNQGRSDEDGAPIDGDTSNASERLNDSRDCEESGPAKPSKKKRPTRNKNVRTVVEDESTLDAKLEKIVLGDAFLDGLSQDYDMSCPAALICYNALTQPSCLLTIESSNLRRDYREPVLPIANAESAELPTILEETENSVDEQNDDPNLAKKRGAVEEDKDGDAMMKEDGQLTTSDRLPPTFTQSINSTSRGHLTNALSNNSSDICNLVTLITKNVNCAQIIRNNQNSHICPRLENFLFNDRTTAISGLDSRADSSTLIDDEPNLNSSRTSGGAHEFNPELYSNQNAEDCYGDEHPGDNDSVLGDVENQPANENDLIPDLNKIAASKPSEYGYSNEHHRLLNTWAGPHAWKVAKAPGTTKKDGVPKSSRKRAKLEQKPIDFNEKFLASLEEIADKDIRHSAEVIRRWKKPLLPQDHNLTEETIRATIIHTFLRPEDTYHCMKTPADALKLVDIDHDYTKAERIGESDNLNASPGLGGFDDVHDDSDDEFRADPVVDGCEVAIYGAPNDNTSVRQADLEFAGEHLIEQPYTVAQVNIPFAKIAKKMDVRKLKRVMWDLLLPPDKRFEITVRANDSRGDQLPDEDGEPNGTAHQTALSGDENNQTVIMNDALVPVKKNSSPTPSESAVHLEFSNLYGELPVRVSSKMASDLSQPIAFVTLLHLANEKVSIRWEFNKTFPL